MNVTLIARQSSSRDERDPRRSFSTPRHMPTGWAGRSSHVTSRSPRRAVGRLRSAPACSPRWRTFAPSGPTASSSTTATA